MLSKKSKYLPLFMWLLTLSFFTYQFILRLWPGLMMQQIMQQFKIDASRFGLLAAFYYYGYSSMQIPTAILLDRYKTRYILAILAVICGFSTMLFYYTNNFYVAIFSRFLIGASSAVGFLGVSKVVSEWFTKTKYVKMIGFSFTIGILGAVYGGKPISMLVERYQWQNVSLVLALISIIIGISVFVFLRSPVEIKEVTSNNDQLKIINFINILTSKTIWLLAFANFLMVGSLEGFADVWGVNFLMKLYNLPKKDAAELISFIFVGMLFGGPILAFISKKIGNYLTIAACGAGIAIAFMLLLFNTTYNWWLLVIFFICVGIMCCYQVTIFAAGANIVSAKNLGVAIAFLNCINMLGGSFFHTIIGKTMDMLWSGTIGIDNLKCYDLSTYQRALSIIPICAIIGMIMVLLICFKINYKRK